MTNENLQLIAERGGYQLYRAIIENGVIPRDLLDSNDKLKIISVHKKPCDRLQVDIDYMPFSEEALRTSIDYSLNLLEGSAIGNPENKQLSLEEAVALQKEAGQKHGCLSHFIKSDNKVLLSLPLAEGHDVNYCQIWPNLITDGKIERGPIKPDSSTEDYQFATMGLHSSDRFSIFSIPPSLIIPKVTSWWRYAKAFSVTAEIRTVLGGHSDQAKERFYSFYTKAKEGIVDEEVIKKVALNKKISPEEVLRVVEYDLDHLGNEIERHESTLAILNYMKSRIEK